MKKLFLTLLLVACGSSTTTGDDASTDGSQSNDGASDASTDSSTNDAAPNDSSTSDVTSGDGGLGSGSTCDPNNNLCQKGLLCCSEPTHNFDGGPLSAYFCETPMNGQCPKIP